MSSLRTVLDYHIGIRQGLDYLQSYQQDNVSAEAIDFNLNQQQERFIDYIFNNEFQDTQRRMDYIQNLVVKNRALQVLRFNTTDADFETDAQYAILPSDYQHLINYRVKTWFDKTNCDLTLLPTWDEVYEQWIAVVPFAIDVVTQPPFYNNVRIEYERTFNAKQVTGVIYFRDFALSDAQEVSPIVQDVVQFSSTPGPVTDTTGAVFSNSFVDGKFKPPIYWENYRGIYYPNSFIVVIPKNQVLSTNTDPKINMVIRDSGNNITKTVTSDMVLESYSVWNTTELVKTLMTDTTSGVQPAQANLYEWQTQNKFYQPDKTEPHINLSKEKVYMYGGKRSLISDLTIDYVRTPRQISLSLNQTSELKGNAPQRIVDWTIERMKLVLENPNVQPLVQHNELRTK